MSEYIKREDAIKEAKAWSMYGEDDLVSRLGRLPSTDIVLCKDCKYRFNTGGATEDWCYKNCIAIDGEDYCSYGEKKDETD